MAAQSLSPLEHILMRDALKKRPPGDIRLLSEEEEFQHWYKNRSGKLDLDPNPDAPAHFYDYRAAHKAGAEADETGHWPSEFKREGHPRMIVNGVNTKTGKRVR